MGDVLAGAWNVFITSPISLIGLRSNVIDADPHTLADWYERVRIPCLDGHGDLNSVCIENSRGKLITCHDPVYGPMLHSSSQVPPLVKREIQSSPLAWPWHRGDRGITSFEKLSLVGCHEAWYVRSNRSGDSVCDAIWRATPTTIWGTLLEEVSAKWTAICLGVGIAHKPADSTNSTLNDTTSDVETESQLQANATPDDSPIGRKLNEDWRRKFTFACGALDPYKHLARIVHTVSINEKVDALMSSVAESTRRGYERGWRHWVFFCHGRQVSPWIDTTKQEWGEAILDFIIHEYSILKLPPPIN